MTIAMIAIGIAPAKINVVPSVAFVPRITMSPSVGAPINDPTATTPYRNNQGNTNATDNNRNR